MNGEKCQGERIRLMASEQEYEVTRLGVYAPRPIEVPALEAGDVGWLTAAIKDIRHARVDIQIKIH
ncbi:MAG: hypothetical protein GWN14_05265 [candidate division Zixibacteria bacterium]|nr:hypothetical protein [candidate division Zixibacteria bacterium]